MSEECFRDGCKKRKYIMTDEEINDFGVSCPYCWDPIEDEDLAPVIFSHLAANALLRERDAEIAAQDAEIERRDAWIVKCEAEIRRLVEGKRLMVRPPDGVTR